VKHRNYAPNVCDNLQDAFDALEDWRKVNPKLRWGYLVTPYPGMRTFVSHLLEIPDPPTTEPVASFHGYGESPSLAIALALAEAYGITIESEITT
jgi:hypothetical protein